MKFLLGIIMIIVLGTIGHWMMPWWIIAVIAGLVSAIVGMRGLSSFCYGFIAVALLWGVYAMMLATANDGVLVEKMGNLFQLSPWAMVPLVTIIGGLLGGMGALTGSWARILLDNKSS